MSKHNKGGQWPSEEEVGELEVGLNRDGTPPVDNYPIPKRITQYQLVYRAKMVVETGIIEASSLERATELGKGWCAQHDCRYINCRDAVLIREDE